MRIATSSCSPTKASAGPLQTWSPGMSGRPPSAEREEGPGSSEAKGGLPPWSGWRTFHWPALTSSS
eukprot:15484915-Alexandrium_andersonii.AAC.1